LPLVVATEILGKPRDRLVRDRQQPVEYDAILLREHCLVIRFQIRLGRGEGRARRIIDEIELKRRAGLSITDRVQAAETFDALPENAVAALPVYVLLEIAGEGSDHLHLMRGEITGQFLKSRFEQNRQVVAID